MALVVASTSNVVTPNADNLTITKPTGVTAGDLLVIVAGTLGDWSSGLFPTCTGFTAQVSQLGGVTGLNPNSSVVFLWRTADASDVAAANYTIAFGGTSTLGAASMFRITGWTAGNPVFSSSSINYTTGTTTVSQSVSLSRVTPQLLIMAGCSQYSTIRTASTYQITSAGTNPTWTEVQDTNFEVSFSGVSRIHAVAYANSSDLQTITNWGFTYSGATTATAAFLIVICEPQDSTGTNALFEVQPTIFSNTGVNVDGNGTNALYAVGPTFLTQSGKGATPTVWTNEANGSTVWTNETY